MFGVITDHATALCNRMFCCIFGWYFYIEIRLKYEKNILLSSRPFSLSTPTFLFSTPVENSEATWKKATKYNKIILALLNQIKCFLTDRTALQVGIKIVVKYWKDF